MEQSPTPHSGEDRLLLPAKWRQYVLPRRGRDRVNTSHPAAVEVDAGASEAVARRIAEARPLLDEWIAGRGRERAAAVAAHLQGRPDPVGAAAVMHLLESTESHRARTNTIPPAARLRHLDAWAGDHGLAFAAVALLESAMVYNMTYARDDRAVAEGGISTYLYWEQPKGWQAAQPAVHRLRSLLASAADAEYREAVAAIDERRTDPERRIGAAILLPTETGWVEQAAEAGSGYFDGRRVDDWMLWAFAADPLHWAIVERRGANPEQLGERNLAPLIEGLGTAALPVLARTMEGRFSRLSKPARAALMTAIGLLPSDEAVAYLVDRSGLPGALTAVMATAERFPHRTLRAVAARTEHADPAERERLAGVVRSSPALGAALAEADERTREAVAALVGGADRVPEAAADALPPLLVAPPWKTKRRKAVVIEGLAPALETRLVWGDAEEARRWATLGDDDPYSRYDPDQTKRRLAYYEEHPDFDHLLTFLSWARVEDAEPLLDRWRGTAEHPGGRDLMRLLGRFGTPVVDRVTDLAKGRSALAEVLAPIRSRAVARIAADWLSRSRSLAPAAKRWFDRHADAAAHLLVPDALGAEAGPRRAANTALRHLAAAQGAEAVAAAAKEYGEAAAEAIGALLDADPLDPLDARVPKPPAWAAPTMLPQVLLKGRRAALPPESVTHLTTVLALDAPELPYAGVEVVAEACDPASLTHFSWKLFELWTAAGAPSKDGWAFTQLARFADDGTVGELAALIRRWPGEGQHKRAVTGLGILGAIGTETSLRTLHGISRKVDFKALKQEAGRQIETVAERLGLTTEQLADRLVPDFGLDDEAGLVLDYGPRRFRVGFDEQLKPFVSDEDGKPLKRLPKPGAEDDVVLAQAAYERFAQLKRDLRTVANEQVRRLEHAMVAGRTWTVPQFREFLADHPLMRHPARRLVWLAETGDGRTAFRLAEDGTCTDVEDDRWDPPADALVRLAHPVDLGDRLADWTGIFADYEILQPFDQLARPVLDFTEEELESGRVTRFDGRTLKSGSVLGLAAHWGWRRAASNGWWIEPGFHYPLPGGGFVVVSLDPGIESYEGRVEASKIQTVRAVHLSASADYAALGEGGRPAAVDPVTAAEVLGALTRITRAA